MLLRALRPFASHPDVGRILITLPEDVAGAPPGWLVAAQGDLVHLVAGGTTRQESVTRALERVRPEAITVLVHDAARPFVSREVIDAVIAVARDGDGAVAALPLTDTLKASNGDGIISATLDRAGLWRAQTPQGFPRAMLEHAHREATTGHAATDDATLVEALGYRVRVVPDSPVNLKVTSPADFQIAQALASRLE